MDKKVKKKVLQQIPYGAYVVGTRMKDGKDHLMFGTWLMQTSFKPTLIAFAFKKDSRTLANVRRSKTFTISLLGKGDGQLAEQVLDEAFDKVRTDRTPSGLPIVRDSAGWIECQLMDMLEKGDHYIVLVEVVDAGPGKGELLVLDALGWHYGGGFAQEFIRRDDTERPPAKVDRSSNARTVPRLPSEHIHEVRFTGASIGFEAFAALDNRNPTPFAGRAGERT